MSDKLKQAVEALKGLMEIAEQAMPDSYFESDSRVNAARKIIEDEEEFEKWFKDNM